MPLPLIPLAAKLVSALTGKGSAAKAAGRAAKGAGKNGRARRKKDGVELEVEVEGGDGEDEVGE